MRSTLPRRVLRYLGELLLKPPFVDLASVAALAERVRFLSRSALPQIADTAPATAISHRYLFRLRTIVEPVFFERSVFHAFSTLDKIAIDRVYRAVGSLGHRRIVKRSAWLIFEMPRLWPSSSLVARK